MPSSTTSICECIGQPHGRLGDAVAFEHFALALGGRAAVAAHGREDERLGAERLQLGDDLLGALGDVVDAAAAAADRDGHAGLHLGADFGALELLGHRRADVGEPLAIELLADVHHPRQRNVESARDVDFDPISDHVTPPFGFAAARAVRFWYCRNVILPPSGEAPPPSGTARRSCGPRHPSCSPGPCRGSAAAARPARSW